MNKKEFILELEKIFSIIVPNISEETALLEFPLIIEKIYNVLALIKTCKTIEEARQHFIALAKIQHFLVIIMMRDNIALPQELIKIVGDCERLDDNMVQEFLFNEIKNQTYYLKSDSHLWYKP